MLNIKELTVDRAILCSDIHLNADTDEITKTFCGWMERNCILSKKQFQPDWLLILGDLFDAWVGDDYLILNSNSSPLKNLRDTFFRIKNAGVSIGIMHGNRDFLLGEKICKNFYAKPLNSTVKLIRPTSPLVLLMHGDELCTKDIEHQKFRNVVRSYSWRSTFLKKDINERELIAKNIRQRSEYTKKEKELFEMDIDDSEAEKHLNKNQAEILIHGHTHLPGKYLLKSGKKRWVIPDWKKLKNNITGGGIKVTKKNITNLSI